MTSKISLNLQLDVLLEKVKSSNAKSVLMQLPDGLKPKVEEIQDLLLEKFPSLKVVFWAGSCYGACDIPNVSGFDLVVQFGHTEWKN